MFALRAQWHCWIWPVDGLNGSLSMLGAVCPVLANSCLTEGIVSNTRSAFARHGYLIPVGTGWSPAVGHTASRGRNRHARRTDAVHNHTLEIILYRVRTERRRSLTSGPCLATGHCSICACRLSARSRHFMEWLMKSTSSIEIERQQKATTKDTATANG